MNTGHIKKWAIIGVLIVFIGQLSAQETNVMIRVQSKDAKFIGTSIGGAQIVIKEESTGKILAEGLTQGTTGDTKIIMNQPHTRGNRLSDDNTAGFLAKLDIQKPVFVSIEALAPVNKRQARVSSTTQQWIIPGKDILGDGIILVVPGFVVDILSPQTHQTLEGREVSIMANIVLMCGCPVTPGGIWNSANYEIKAIVSQGGKEVKTLDLLPQKVQSTFGADITLNSGNYEILVYAIDPVTGNTGLDKTNIIIP